MALEAQGRSNKEEWFGKLRVRGADAGLAADEVDLLAEWLGGLAWRGKSNTSKSLQNLRYFALSPNSTIHEFSPDTLYQCLFQMSTFLNLFRRPRGLFATICRKYG